PAAATQNSIISNATRRNGRIARPRSRRSPRPCRQSSPNGSPACPLRPCRNNRPCNENIGGVEGIAATLYFIILILYLAKFLGGDHHAKPNNPGVHHVGLGAHRDAIGGTGPGSGWTGHRRLGARGSDGR